MFQLIIKTLGLVKDFSDAKEWFGKRWFLSKALWVNALAVLALWLQSQMGFVLSSDDQLVILAFVNIVLRFFSEQPLVFREKDIAHLTPELPKDG